MRRAAAALALLLALATRPAAAIEGFQYTREVQVPAAGRVRVPLDLAALRHLAPGAADLHVFAPGGGQVPSQVEPWTPRIGRRAVVVVEVEEGRDGWTLLLDTGTEPTPHERLVFDFDRPAAVPAVRLEGSPDGETWKTLTVGDLFRVGGERGLRQTSLSYPATTDRYLRLAWPEAAGFPKVSAVEVETVSGPSLTFSTGDVKCDRGRPEVAVCELILPATGQVLRRLTLELAGTGTAGYRLYEPRQARWEPLAEGVWQRGAESTRHVLAGRPQPVRADRLRLELHGSAGEAPRLVSYGIDLAVPTVLFEAGEPGSYVLAYGGGVRGERGERGLETSGEDESWLEAGPEREQPRPSLPAQATAPGSRLPRERFAASWTVIAPSARPGDLVRLEVPVAVYGAARADLGDLRIEVGGHQVPFFRWSPPEPALAVERLGAQPADTGREGGESQVGISLPAAGLPLSELGLTVPPRPLRREVGVRYIDNRLRRPGSRRGEPPPVTQQTWECSPAAPLPCRALLSLPGRAPELLALHFEDGDNPPLSEVDVALWRRRDVLLFAWPEGGPVHLRAGAPGLTSPEYDLDSLGDLLLARTWQPAELDRAGAQGEAPRWSRWVMPGALLVAGAFLLLLLRRILSAA